MEETNVNGCKFVLATYEGNGNHYYDTTFNLRAPFSHNSNGQYSVTINEVWFKNNEPTLDKNDYIDFKIYVKGENEPRVVRFMMLHDIFTYAPSGQKTILDILTDETIFNYMTYEVIAWPSPADGFETLEDIGIDAIAPVIYDEVNNHYSRTDENEAGRNPVQFPVQTSLQIIFMRGSSYAWTNDIRFVEMSYTDNWAYVLNNMNMKLGAKIERIDVEQEGGSTAEQVCATFDFYNLRICGPYIYIIETPLTAVINTYNANNQGYNVVALSYNNAPYHNSTISMSSSMECTTNDLSNFRIRLINDQFETVHIREPIYVQITVKNQG